MPTVAELRSVAGDPMLTPFSVAYANDQDVYIADDVLPPVPVVLESDTFLIGDKSRFNIPEAKRNPRGHYKEIDWTATKDSYFAEEYGLETRIDDRERRNSPQMLDLDEQGVEILTDAILLNRERRVANLVTNTANITQNVTLAGATQWSDPASVPLNQSRDARLAIQASTGQFPNSLAMGWLVLEKMKTNPAIADFLEGDRPTSENLADYFEVENIFIGRASYNTAKEGQTATLADVWGRDALFFFRVPRPALRRAAFGYQMQVQGLQVERYRDNPAKSDVIRVTEIRGEKLVEPKMAYLVKAAVPA